MRKNPKTRFLPIVILPAILPALLMPVLRSLEVPDSVLGGTMGFSIGLAIVGLIWMVKPSSPSSAAGS
jgi:hypothetical protein